MLGTLTSQSCRNLVDRLRELGLGRYIDLPQIATMGDTSSGKSSVLTALSGIEFPSNDKLTTRCPTQLNLSTAEEFSGTIRLQRYDKQSKSQDVAPISILKIEDIAGHIEKLTQMLVDEGQSISDDSIVIDARCVFHPLNVNLADQRSQI
jgi:hypothetical protein